MELVAWSILILVASGVLAWMVRYKAEAPALVGAAGCLAAAALGVWSAGNCLLGRQLETRRVLWNAPFASLSLGIDSLTALFLLPLFIVGALTALHAWRRRPGSFASNRPHEHWLYFNLTLGAAALVATARNAVLFLFAWELMTVASFLLVENRQRQAGQRGGWVYLTAGHLGGACLFAMFALLGAGGDGFDFNAFAADGGAATAVFLLAFAGFGGKAGLFPFHAWYPESYPQAAAPTAALLSGVVGNFGIYGLARMLLLLSAGNPPPSWWGYLLLGSGLVTALLGAARALTARDLHRLLAWSSAENYGLMATGLGLGLLGATSGRAAVSFLGFAAAFVHMLNHAVAKTLLFLAGDELTARAGTRDLGAMGGLLKVLPVTGGLFLVGALGAAAIPPLNGFVGEFLLLMAAYNGAAGYRPASFAAASMLLVIAAVATAAGLAAAAYVKAFAFAFLGNPRGAGAASAAPEPRSRLIPQCILAGACLLMAGLSPALFRFVRPVAEVLSRSCSRTAAPNAQLAGVLEVTAMNPLRSVWLGCWLLAGCLVAVWAARHLLLRGKKAASQPTWDCGYAAPDSRMQYTESSLVQPLADNFRSFSAHTETETPPAGIFPAAAAFSTATPTAERAWGFRQLFAGVAWLASRLWALQEGRVQTYLLYMGAVLVLLLLWKL